MSDSIWVREIFFQTTKCFARSNFPTVHAITNSTFCIIRAKLIHTNAVVISQYKALDLRRDWRRSRSSIDLAEGDTFSESWVLSIGPLIELNGMNIKTWYICLLPLTSGNFRTSPFKGVVLTVKDGPSYTYNATINHSHYVNFGSILM